MAKTEFGCEVPHNPIQEDMLPLLVAFPSRSAFHFWRVSNGCGSKSKVINPNMACPGKATSKTPAVQLGQMTRFLGSRLSESQVWCLACVSWSTICPGSAWPCPCTPPRRSHGARHLGDREGSCQKPEPRWGGLAEGNCIVFVGCGYITLVLERGK